MEYNQLASKEIASIDGKSNRLFSLVPDFNSSATSLLAQNLQAELLPLTLSSLCEEAGIRVLKILPASLISLLENRNFDSAIAFCKEKGVKINSNLSEFLLYEILRLKFLDLVYNEKIIEALNLIQTELNHFPEFFNKEQSKLLDLFITDDRKNLIINNFFDIGSNEKLKEYINLLEFSLQNKSNPSPQVQHPFMDILKDAASYSILSCKYHSKFNYRDIKSFKDLFDHSECKPPNLELKNALSIGPARYEIFNVVVNRSHSLIYTSAKTKEICCWKINVSNSSASLFWSKDIVEPQEIIKLVLNDSLNQLLIAVDRSIIMMNSDDGVRTKLLAIAHNEPLLDFVLLSSVNNYVSSSYDQCLSVWNRQLEQQTEIKVGKSLALLPFRKDSVLFLNCSGKSINEYSVANRKIKNKLALFHAPIVSMALSPSEDYLLANLKVETGLMELLCAKTWQKMISFRGFEQNKYISTCGFLSEKIVYVFSQNKELIFWMSTSSTIEKKVQIDVNSVKEAAVFYHDGKICAIFPGEEKNLQIMIRN